MDLLTVRVSSCHRLTLLQIIARPQDELTYVRIIAKLKELRKVLFKAPFRIFLESRFICEFTSFKFSCLDADWDVWMCELTSCQT